MKNKQAKQTGSGGMATDRGERTRQLRGRPVKDEAVVKTRPDPIIDHCVGIRGGLVEMRNCRRDATHTAVVLQDGELQELALCDECGQRGGSGCE